MLARVVGSDALRHEVREIVRTDAGADELEVEHRELVVGTEENVVGAIVAVCEGVWAFRQRCKQWCDVLTELRPHLHD